MTPIPYLFFKDQCRAAMTAYGEIFGTSPQIMDFASMPETDRAQMPGVPANAVMHAMLPLGEGMIYASDDPTGDTAAMEGCNIALELPDEAETRRVWDALAKDGDIRMPLEPQFWTPLFGTLTDRFGIRWMIMQESAEG